MTQRPAHDMLDDVARDRIPDNLDLLPRIAAHYEKQKGPSMKPRFKFALAIVLALAVFAVIVSTVPPVASAMQHVLGYVPGLGLVEQGAPLRVLAQPVMVEREGVRVTIDKGSSDTLRTILLVAVDGMPSSDQRAGCTDGAPSLRLADGKILPVKEAAGFGHDTGYNQRMVFGALPAKAEKVTLELPCLLITAAGQAPENWLIPLVFAPASDLEVLPVIELPPTPVVQQPGSAAASTTSEPKEASQPGASPYGITFTLEKIAELEDGYILMGSMAWTDPTLGDYGVTSTNPILLDADGQPVPFTYVAPDTSPAPGSKRSQWAYKIMGKEHRWPLTLKANADVMLALPNPPSFALDLSSPPAPGQSQEINTTVEAAGHTLIVLSYNVNKDEEGNGVLDFLVKTDPGVIGLSLFDAEHPVLGGGGGGGGGSDTSREPIQAGFTYNGALPAGQVQISISVLMLSIDGGWAVTWQP